MTNLRRLAALLPCSVLFIAPGFSAAQLFSPIPEHVGETSNPTHTAQGQEAAVIPQAPSIERIEVLGTKLPE